MVTAYQPYSSESAAVQLQNRLNDPQTAAALNQILDRAELLAFTVSSLDGLLGRSEQIADEAARSLQDLKEATPPEFSNFFNYLPQLIELLPSFLAFAPHFIGLVNSKEFQRLLDVLSNPQTLDAITTLIKNMDKVAFAVEAVDGFLQRGDSIIENVASAVNDAPKFDDGGNSLSALLQALPQLSGSLPNLIQLTESVLPLLQSEAVQNFIQSGGLERLVSSGILDPKTIDVIDQTGGALVDSYDKASKNPEQIGLMGLVRAMRDPNLQKSLGFFVEFGKQFGKGM